MSTNAPRIRTEALKVGFATVVLSWIALHVGRALYWLTRQPVLWIFASLVSAGWWLHDQVGGYSTALIGLGATGVLMAWRLVHRPSFCAALVFPIRAWLREVFVYKREWKAMCVNLSLAHKHGDDLRYPDVLSVHSTATVDKVRVKLQPGQVLADFSKNADRLAQTFEALDCRVRSIPRPQPFAMLVYRVLRLVGKPADPPQARPSRKLELWFLLKDPLAAPVAMLRVSDRPNLKALPVAVREDGLIWHLRLLATHVLLIGATGAGKGSVLWSIVRALGNGIRTGLVELWVIDPKGGMEFASGQRLYARYCYGNDEPTEETGSADTRLKKGFESGYAVFLETLVEKMHERQARLRGILRVHKPAPGDPFIVVLIDEFASLTAYVTDRETKKRIESALNLLLSQGRAVGICLIAAAQDPRKEVVDMRGLFPTRIALRLNEPDEVDLVLRKGSRDRGARCDEISDDLPGIGYVQMDDRTEPVRVRFAYVDDDEIDTMCSLYAPGAPDVGTGLTERRLRLVDTSSNSSDEGEAAS